MEKNINNTGTKLANIINAISQMKETGGSSLKNIVRYIAQNMYKYRNYPSSSQSIKNDVIKALRTGTRNGVIVNVGKKFKINRACNFHRRMTKTNRRKGGRKSRRRRSRSRSRRGKRHALYPNDGPVNGNMENSQMVDEKPAEPMDKGRRRRQPRRRKSRSRRTRRVKRHTDNEIVDPNPNNLSIDFINQNTNSSTEEMLN